MRIRYFPFSLLFLLPSTNLPPPLRIIRSFKDIKIEAEKRVKENSRRRKNDSTDDSETTTLLALISAREFSHFSFYVREVEIRRRHIFLRFPEMTFWITKPRTIDVGLLKRMYRESKKCGLIPGASALH